MKYVWALVALFALTIGTALAQQDPAQQPYPPAQSSQTSQQQYPYPQTTGSMVIPAGTQLSIRTNENITADQQSAGRQYSAELAQDISGPNGQVIVPKGSPATLTVQNVSSGKLGVGNNEVALALQSLQVNGRSYVVQSNTAQQSGDRGIGKNKRTAEMTGGGAVLGTVIGAVAGGAKGAVIGAIAGAGAGATAQVLTRGHEVKVPAETVLTFRLDQPLTLQ